MLLAATSTPWWVTILAVLVGSLTSGLATWVLAPRIARRQRIAERREEALLNIHALADLRLQRLLVAVKVGTVGYDKLLESITDDDEAGHDDIRADLDHLDEKVDALRAALQPLSTWIVQADDEQLTNAWRQLATGAILYDYSGMPQTVKERIVAALQAEKRMDRMEQAQKTLASRSLTLLGHPTRSLRRRRLRPTHNPPVPANLRS